MRRTLLAVLAVVFAAALAAPLRAQGAPPQGSADQPYTMEYYYKLQWGHQQEFLDLFLKNHYPLLKKIQSTGRILSIKIESPANHTTEDGRWDYRVTIRYKNSTVATTANPDEAAAASSSYLRMFALVALGFMWLKMAKAAQANAPTMESTASA